MGADTFTTYSEGADIDTAFREAIEYARYEYGHGGYTGTIAEKDSYVVIDGLPRPQDDAQALAERLFDLGDKRISNKWGPAGAIAVCREPTDAAGPIRATAEPLDKPAAIASGSTDGAADIQPSAATGAAPGSAQVTGWLFFGWASC